MRPWIFLYAIILHIVWGLVLLFDERASWTTGLYAVVNLCGGTKLAAIVLIVVGVLAIGSLYPKIKLKHGLFCLCPQQFFIIVSAWGATKASIDSSFADGVVRPSAFIFADQFPSILLAVVHTGALMEHFGMLFGGLLFTWTNQHSGRH